MQVILLGLHLSRRSLANCCTTPPKLLAAHPNQEAALNNLALLLSRSSADLDDALSLARQAHDARPDDARIADTLGYIHQLRGDHALARPLRLRAALTHADAFEGNRDTRALLAGAVVGVPKAR